jgi:hypothetical protein
MKTWSHFDRYADIINKYMPRSGEGSTVASQTCTAVNKLIYKWFNDGDIYDNTQHLEGWANNLSSYANWLYTYCPECQSILNRIYTVRTEDEYTDILGDLADTLIDADALEMVAHKPAEGSIYECPGPFVYEDIYNTWDDAEEEDDDKEMCW